MQHGIHERPATRSRGGIRRLAAALLGVTALAVAAVPVGQASAALAPNSPPAGAATMVPATGTTSFRLQLPSGAACPGDSVTGGYRWQTFLVASTVDVAQLTYAGNVVTAPAAAQADLLYSSGNPSFDNNTAITTGAIIGLPTSFEFTVFPANYLAAGTYKLGVACTLSGAVEKYWSTTFKITLDGGGLVNGFSPFNVPATAPTVNSPLTTGISGVISGSITGASASPAITSYTVTATPAVGSPVTTTVTPPATTFSFSGLVNDTSYTVTATGTNAAGTSPVSAGVVGTPFAGTAPTAPTVNAPLTTGVSGAISGSITGVTASPAVTSYTVTATPAAGSPVSTQVVPPATAFTLSGLVNGTSYDVTATATNIVGTSSPSASVAGVPFAAAAPSAPTVNAPLTVGVSGTISGSITGVVATPSVDSYTVTATPTSGTPVSVQVVPPATTFTLSGLANRVRYTVTATATNTVGTSSPSAGVLATPYVAGPAPTQLAAGAAHTCALVTGGTVRCWGLNTNGQLGNNSLTSSATPVTASGLTGVTHVAAGELFNCAVTAGKVKCWGVNTTGQLGNGSVVRKLTPTFVTTTGTTPLAGVSKVAAGIGFACALSSPGAAGVVRCWGANNVGQLSDGTITTRTRPVQVKANATTALKGVTQIAAGGSSACALFTSGAVRCWGLNTSGQLGNNSLVSSKFPVQVSGIDGVAAKATSITVGANFACARISNGTVRCWGGNASGQLGNNTVTNSKVPVVVKTSATAALTGATTVVAGAGHVCVVRGAAAAARVSCWGNNANGQLGVGDTVNRRVATALTTTSLNGVKSIALGGAHTVAVVPSTVRTPSDAAGWGRNANGQLGISGTPKTTAAIITSL